MFNQTSIGTISRATLGRLLKDGVKLVWAFLSATMPSRAETETELKQMTSHLSTAYQGRSAETLEGLSQHGQTRASEN